MQTTAVIVEILVIGLLLLISIILNLSAVININYKNIIDIAVSLKDYSSLFTIIILSIAYILGWLSNSISYHLARHTYMKNIQKNIFGEQIERFPVMRDAVYSKGSDNAVNKIKERIHGVRILRTSVLSLLLATIGSLLHSWYQLSLVLFLLSLIFSYSAYNSYQDYTKRILNTYEGLQAENN